MISLRRGPARDQVIGTARDDQPDNPRDIHSAKIIHQKSGIGAGRHEGKLHGNTDDVEGQGDDIPVAVTTATRNEELIDRIMPATNNIVPSR